MIYCVSSSSIVSLSDFLLSLSVKDRRQYYRTSGSVPLDDIPAWTPTAGQTPDISQSHCQVHSGSGGGGGDGQTFL